MKLNCGDQFCKKNKKYCFIFFSFIKYLYILGCYIYNKCLYILGCYKKYFLIKKHVVR